MNLFSISVLLLFCLSAFSQKGQPVKTESDRALTNMPKVITVHIPKGYEMLDTTFGHLNLDPVPDVIVALKSPSEKYIG